MLLLFGKTGVIQGGKIVLHILKTIDRILHLRDLDASIVNYLSTVIGI